MCAQSVSRVSTWITRLSRDRRFPGRFQNACLYTLRLVLSRRHRSARLAGCFACVCLSVRAINNWHRGNAPRLRWIRWSDITGIATRIWAWQVDVRRGTRQIGRFEYSTHRAESIANLFPARSKILAAFESINSSGNRFPESQLENLFSWTLASESLGGVRESRFTHVRNLVMQFTLSQTPRF